MGQAGGVGTGKRKRQKANRQAKAEASQPVPVLTDADLDGLLTDVTVRTDCEHASTRTTSDGPVLLRCAVGASVAGGCPRDCPAFEKRRVGGRGF
ncbi:MAG TPA: hypothetical protein VG455_11765 [Acidimicrobiales bacterium]|nr:hypothetical protein [Acidimicrobiales bacterium]